MSQARASGDTHLARAGWGWEGIPRLRPQMGDRSRRLDDLVYDSAGCQWL